MFIDGKYRLSLFVSQIIELGIKQGQEFSEDELNSLENESAYGKLFASTLEYVLVRPRSIRELDDYLKRKQLYRFSKDGKKIPGVSSATANKVRSSILDKGYVSDEAFTSYWVENRNLRKGISLKKLRSELIKKGVSPSIIGQVIENSGREDEDELNKVIAKKSGRYDDPNKLKAYLLGQGFSYDDIQKAINSNNDYDFD